LRETTLYFRRRRRRRRRRRFGLFSFDYVVRQQIGVKMAISTPGGGGETYYFVVVVVQRNRLWEICSQ